MYGDRQKKGGEIPRHRHQALILASASAILRISVRASRITVNAKIIGRFSPFLMSAIGH
ncbi:hypothetical protein GP121_003926 [Salmonella enterica]|nr:hypothetical protein [Salmonella enterica]EDW3959167.1 hypothetical protein [Salmonella enterica subsp. enterica]EDY0719143.1 hypothetical protein [Salmonella enterica subsp. enterica]